MSVVDIKQAQATAREMARPIEDIADAFDVKELEDERPYVPICLPNEFWGARKVLRQIRDYAFWHTVSPDALLLSCMIRIAAYVSHETKIYSSKTPSSLNMLGAIVGPSGSGKSQVDEPASRIIPTPQFMLDPIPPGSGEGIAEAFMSKGKNREQIHNNVFMFGDEGRIMQTFKERKGATFDEYLCATFTGKPFGQSNASKETTRLVRNYAFGLLVNLIPTTVYYLSEQSHGGLPQRIVFASSQHPSIPHPDILTEADAVEAPRIDITCVGKRIEFCKNFKKEVEHTKWLHSRPRELLTEEQLKEVVNDGWSSHLPWLRAKVGSCLAIIDGRTFVEEEDIRLADMFLDYSNKVREEAMRVAQKQIEDDEMKRNEVMMRSAELKHVAVRGSEKRLFSVARRLEAHVLKVRRISSGNLRARLHKDERHMFDSAIRLVLQDKKVGEVVDGNHTFYVAL